MTNTTMTAKHAAATGTPKRPPARRVIDALAFLSGLRAIVVDLEDGARRTFDAAVELSIPDDAISQIGAAKAAPAKLAFWTYQAARALRRVRLAEVELASVESKRSIGWRQAWTEAIYQEQARQGAPRRDPFVTDAMVRAGVDDDEDIVAKRRALAEARLYYDRLRSVQVAAEHRIFVLRKLIGQREDVADA